MVWSALSYCRSRTGWQHQHVLYDELASEEIQHTHRTGLSADFHEIGVEQVHGRQHQYE